MMGLAGKGTAGRRQGVLSGHGGQGGEDGLAAAEGKSGQQ
jgi:hypothetical protein